jgi:selenocysteine-specific elongation factor
LSRKTIIQIDKDQKVYVHGDTFEKLEREIRERLEAYHAARPLKAGMPREELKSKLPRGIDSRLFRKVIDKMARDALIVHEENMVRMAGHKVSLKVDQDDVRKKIIDIYKRAELTPPYFKDVGKELAVDPAAARDVMSMLVDQGEIVKVKEELYFYKASVEELKDRLVDFLRSNTEISTPQFKEMAGVSRKYVIPLIEYFDSNNITIRVGDNRRLRTG